MKVRFNSWPELHWPLPLEFYFKIEVLESISKAIRVMACGHEGDDGADLQEAKFKTLFSGVLNDTVMRDRLEEYLYSIVDVAHQTTAAEEGSRWLHTTGAKLE